MAPTFGNPSSSEPRSLKVPQPVPAKGLLSKLDLPVQKRCCSRMGGLFVDSGCLTLPAQTVDATPT
jgi:hypothetical protein